MTTAVSHTEHTGRQGIIRPLAAWAAARYPLCEVGDSRGHWQVEAVAESFGVQACRAEQPELDRCREVAFVGVQQAAEKKNVPAAAAISRSRVSRAKTPHRV